MWFLPLLFFIFAPQVNAQESSPPVFSQYQSDYLYQYNLYQQAYSKYLEKDQVYKKYGTITVQKEKISAAIEAINARNRTFRSYFMSLRVMLEDYKTAHPDETQTIQNSLSEWENWFEQQQPIVSVIDNQNDLQKWVADFQSKYPQIQKIMYTALVQHETNLRQQTLNQIQILAQDIQNNPQIKPESQQWISTLADKSGVVSNSLNSAISLAQKKQSSGHFSNFYSTARTELTKARNNLTEITTDLKLIVSRFYLP